MKRRKTGRRPEGLSLSFLDAISCGFGAIVMLLVLSKIGEPIALEAARTDLEARVLALQEELFEIRGETEILQRELTSKRRQQSIETENVARLRADLSELPGQHAATRELSEVQDLLEGRLLAAQQKLTEEMRRLQRQRAAPPPRETTVGGVPVDSEYIVFIIDTSGSMTGNAWPLVVRKMSETLAIYPRVKGIQVMSDQGQYMFSGYARKWIPDTPGRRKAIVNRLRNWRVVSNSSPVEGITRAIRTFGAADKKVSLYVFGDEFTGDSIQEVLDTVDKINRRDEDGNPRVRIHAVGFPVVFTSFGSGQTTGVRFATLMRALCERNGGTFVALNSTRP